MKRLIIFLVSCLVLLSCNNIPKDIDMAQALIIGKWKVVESRMPYSEIKLLRDWRETLNSEFFIFTDNIAREIHIDDYTSDEFYDPCTNDTTLDMEYYYRIIEKQGNMYLELYNNFGDGNELWERFEIKKLNDTQLNLECDKGHFSIEWDVDYKLERIY